MRCLACSWPLLSGLRPPGIAQHKLPPAWRRALLTQKLRHPSSDNDGTRLYRNARRLARLALLLFAASACYARFRPLRRHGTFFPASILADRHWTCSAGRDVVGACLYLRTWRFACGNGGRRGMGGVALVLHDVAFHAAFQRCATPAAARGRPAAWHATCSSL